MFTVALQRCEHWDAAARIAVEDGYGLMFEAEEELAGVWGSSRRC
jgi:hypothetical protein